MFGFKKKAKLTNEDSSLIDKLSNKNAVTGIFSKKNRRIATVFLWERIGKNEIFKGSYPLLKGIIKDLGEYVILDLNGKSIFLNVPHYNDYFPSNNPKIGKILEVVKFAEDDFRVKCRLTEEYSAVKEVPDMLVKEVCSVCDKLWDNCSCSNKDEENKVIIKVQKTDKKTGKPMFVKETIRWEEPRGVNQEGRDSIRSMNNYQRRMEEHRKKNGGFWAKYGGLIAFIMAMVFATGICCYSIYKVNENLKLTVEEVHNSVQSAQWWKNPDIIQSISSGIVQKQDEKTNPPTGIITTPIPTK
jgi:hypothetical protein